MIKKGCLFGFVVLCSLFVLTGCPKKAEPKEVEVKVFSAERDFASLKGTGFVPPVVRLGETYVNDKIESKDKTLSYEYYYKRSTFGSDDYKDALEGVFSPGNNFHTATIKESDAGDASKTKLKYDKLKDVNGGELYIGSRFVLGLIVKDQNGEDLYKSKVKFYVTAPQADVKAEAGLKISIPGDHRLNNPTNAKADSTTYDDGKGRTMFTIEGTPSAGDLVDLTFGAGKGEKTCKVVLKS